MKNIVIGRFARRHVKTLPILCLFVSLFSQAGLINRGNGLIYDDVLNVTWMQNADYLRTSGHDVDGFVNKTIANDWVENLVYEGYDDWRLPSQTAIDGNAFGLAFSFDGSTDRGFNQSGTHNELNYMFYNNLANVAFWDSAGDSGQAGSESFNSSFVDAVTGELFSFQNISFNYWSDPEDNPINNASWGFAFRNTNNSTIGEVQLLNSFASISAWAVRDGDVSVNDNVFTVSSPNVFALMFFGITGVLATRRQNA